MRLLLFMAHLLLTSVTGNSQNLLGCKADEIRNYMTEKRSDMNLEKVNNKSFSYLKYSDNFDTQTILFFLDTDSVCRTIRMVCNHNIRDAKIKELDSSFSRTAKNRWIDSRSGKKYYIRLDDDEWSFTVTIEPEK